MHPLLMLKERDPTFTTRYLERDLRSLQQRYEAKPHFGHYHDGGWHGLGLIAAGGDVHEGRPLHGVGFEKTAALRSAPYIEEIIDSFPGQKERVRLLSLGPGDDIFWHYDFAPALARRNLRFHVAISTNPRVRFQISHQELTCRPGELWLGDFSFPHRVCNGGMEPRIHLVMDVLLDDKVQSDLSRLVSRYLDEAGVRDAVRRRLRRRYGWWFRLDPRVVISHLRVWRDARAR